MALLQQHLQWLELAGGEVLMEQGAPGDRLISASAVGCVYVRDGEAAQRMVREMSRGEVIGEMRLYTGEPRAATVIALRKTVLIKLDKQHFDQLLALSPQVSVTFTRQIIRRPQTEHLRLPVPAAVTTGVLPVTDGIALDGFARRLAEQLRRFGRACVVNAAEMVRVLGEPGVALNDERGAHTRITHALDALKPSTISSCCWRNRYPDRGRAAA